MIRVLLLCACVFAGSALAEEAKTKDTGPVPWRGSTVSLASLTSTNSFDRGAELTYNPYSAVSLTIAPRWWVSRTLFARASVALTHELTEPDVTTYSNETLLSDTTLGFGGILGVIPVVDILTFGTVDLRLPTSKASQAATMNVAIVPTLTLWKNWAQLAGLNVWLTTQAVRFNHDFTTRQTLDNTGRCSSAGATCEPFLHTGVRNPRWRLSGGGGIGIFPSRWFQANIGVSVIQDHLHDDIETTAVNPFGPDAGVDTRELMSYSVTATFMLNPWQVSVGTQTINPQLSPEGGYYRPFFNRFTLFNAAVTYSFGGVFIPQQQDEEES